MPLRSIPRWLRTALVFLASLQAARAGSVEAQSPANHRMEQAAAASAPREPIAVLREPAPLAVALAPGLRDQAVVRLSDLLAERAAPGTRAPARAVVAASLVVAGSIPALSGGGRLLASADKRAPARPEPRGAYRARAPCPASARN